MNTTAARAEAAAPDVRAEGVAWLPPRGRAVLLGPVGLVIKIFLLALVNALAVWAAIVLADEGKWVAVAVLAVTTLADRSRLLHASRAAAEVPDSRERSS